MEGMLVVAISINKRSCGSSEEWLLNAITLVKEKVFPV